MVTGNLESAEKIVGNLEGRKYHRESQFGFSARNFGIESKAHPEKEHLSISNYIKFTSHRMCRLWGMCQHVSSKGVGSEAG